MLHGNRKMDLIPLIFQISFLYDLILTYRLFGISQKLHAVSRQRDSFTVKDLDTKLFL